MVLHPSVREDDGASWQYAEGRGEGSLSGTAHEAMNADSEGCRVHVVRGGCEKLPSLRTAQRYREDVALESYMLRWH